MNMQLSLFDINKKEVGTKKTKFTSELTLFIDEIDIKTTYSSLGIWRFKHQNRIRKLEHKDRKILNEYYQERRKKLKKNL